MQEGFDFIISKAAFGHFLDSRRAGIHGGRVKLCFEFVQLFFKFRDFINLRRGFDRLAHCCISIALRRVAVCGQACQFCGKFRNARVHFGREFCFHFFCFLCGLLRDIVLLRLHVHSVRAA